MTSAPKAFFVPRPLLKLSLISMKFISDDGELFLGVSIITLINCYNFLKETFANFYTSSEIFLWLFTFSSWPSKAALSQKGIVVKQLSSFLCYSTDKNVKKEDECSFVSFLTCYCWLGYCQGSALAKDKSWCEFSRCTTQLSLSIRKITQFSNTSTWRKFVLL